MIGVYNYTVLLTYMSLFSACAGIASAFMGNGHPYLAALFLLICGLLDAFDGKVASTKKDRTDMERHFGIQIDSLSDMVAFGVLPACIGVSLLNRASVFDGTTWYMKALRLIVFAITILYVLAALIRLAYYNVTEEERQRTETGSRRYYTGVPVTMSSLTFPLIMAINYFFRADLTPVYFVFVAFFTVAFISRLRVPKPGMRGVIGMVFFGVAELTLLILALAGV